VCWWGRFFIPFFIVPKKWSGSSGGWFRCFIQYAFYQVIAAAWFISLETSCSVRCASHLLAPFPVQLIAWFPVLFITFLASIYTLLKVPALTNHIFSGTAVDPLQRLWKGSSDEQRREFQRLPNASYLDRVVIPW